MLLTSNQLFQACKTTDSNINPENTITPLQAAKNAMRTKLEAQYGSIDKIMDK
jgi:hypothetical protein